MRLLKTDFHFGYGKPKGKLFDLDIETPIPATPEVQEEEETSLDGNEQPKENRLDLRHRIPFTFPHYDNVLEIEEEISSMSVDTQNTFDHIKLFFCVYFKSLLEPDELKIINYFEGSISLDEIGLTRENAAAYLRLVKIVDLALIWQTRISRTKIQFKNTSEPVRTRILELLSPELPTTVAYTLAVNPKKLNSDYLKDPLHWIPERIGLYAKSLIPQEYVKLLALSNRIKESIPRVFALRGSTAAGKTTFAAHNITGALDEKGELSGSVNPDQMKLILRTAGNLSNMQVHEEVVRGPLSRYKEEILHQNDKSIILDTRLSSDTDFETGVLEAAAARNGKATVIDLDVPLSTSLNRVLKDRDPKGVHPKAIKEGWVEVRKSRPGIIEWICKNSLVDYYQLIQKGKVVAEKKGDLFEVHSQKGLTESCSLPTAEEIESDYNQIVDEGKWQNIPISKALASNAMGASPSTALKEMEREKHLHDLYGTTQLHPFTGAWLSDYPQIKEHLESEHLLHIRGADEWGRGLHWQSNKFAWKLNPEFNPEAHFEMKLGYFVIPPTNCETIRSLSLSPEVLKELEVRNGGRLTGYRFFVHPEAYAHFQMLHEEKIPFVKPEDSEFIGTPTSSYRSWAVRHMEKEEAKPGSVPFIVKLGVGDGSRLLDKEEVEKSVRAQNYFDMLPKREDLVIFAESFGLTLKNSDSGIIIREFPKELIEGKCQIYSFSALMSVEGAKEGKLPLIYEIIEAAIKKGFVKTSYEFMQRYLITGVLNALEPLAFKEGNSLALHGQNLCMVLNNDRTPRGIAIRDHGDMNKRRRYLETYSWFYRYHVFVKLLNVITSSDGDFMPPIPGAPTQIGSRVPLKERNLNRYLQDKITSGAGLKALKELSLDFAAYQSLLNLLDQNYLTLLSRYFDCETAGIMGPVPAAEVGSAGESALMRVNKSLWENRK